MKPPSKPSPNASLFAEPERLQGGIYIANIDGGSRGNPGPASYGVVVRAPNGTVIFRIGKYLGKATNNVAEYYGLIGALDYVHSQHIARLAVRSDSELMVRQMLGRYQVKSPDLKPLHERAQKMARALAHFEIVYVPREQNSEADEMANLAMDAESTVGGPQGPSQPPQTRPKPPADVVVTASASGTNIPARPIRARYSAGALHLLEALDLAEGEVVELTVRKPEPR